MAILVSSLDFNNTSTSKSTGGVSLDQRALCNANQVKEDDGCASLTTKCEIKGADFLKLNPAPNLYTTLKVNQWVCCSAGTLPDYRTST